MPDKHNSLIKKIIFKQSRRELGGCAVLALPFVLSACADNSGDVSAGRVLFEGQCQGCHRSGAATLKTPVAKVPALLRGGSIRTHRFHLDDTQLRDLEAYLTEVKAGGD
jgi:mono/diheme cytochrome c family protein